MTRPTALAALAALALAGCGPADGPAELAARACDAQVQQQVQSQPYRLDLDVLAAGKTDDGRGGFLLSAPITVNLGLANESVQQLECTVRISGEPPVAEVVNLRFIW
jgi:predicted small lipoprotein YifL